MPSKRRRRGLTVGKVRTALYKVARVLGDVQALRRGPRAMVRRVERRVVGRLVGRFLGRFLR